MSEQFHGLDVAMSKPEQPVAAKQPITLREILHQIEALREKHGDAILDAPCDTEGCDCTGACSGVEGDLRGVLFMRDPHG